MKTIQFTQVANTHNEYTSDALSDASGTYVNFIDLMDYADHRLRELAAEAATAYTDADAEVIRTRAAEVNLLVKELDLLVKEMGKK